MDESNLLAGRFEASRPRLRAVAYRMLGSLSDADDAVQEAWLHAAGSDAAAVANLEGWFTTIVARVCLDMLRSRKSRREEPLNPDRRHRRPGPAGRARPGRARGLTEASGSHPFGPGKQGPCPPPASRSSCSTAGRPPRAQEYRALHAEVHADPPYRQPDDAAYGGRFGVQRRQPGFALAEARNGGYLVGYAAGMPLRPSTSWWRELTTPLPAEVTAEHPGRTFALVDLLVRASWRRQGIARTLHDLILAGRPEERATLTVLPAANPAQGAFAVWAGARSRGRAAVPADRCPTSW